MTLLVILLVLPVVAFFALGVYSGRQAPMAVSPEQAFACGPAPNCVCSEQVETPSQAIEPLKLAKLSNDGQDAQQALIDAVKTTGGQIIDTRPGLIVATYTSNIFGFVDDVAIKINDAEQYADIISQSRVGYSDLGANRKRVEKIRAALREN